jgi:hypothetical protein
VSRSCASSRHPAASSAKGASAWAGWELPRRSIAPMVKIADCIRCDGPLRTANHGSARLARNCRLFRRTRPRHSTIGSSLGVSRLASESGPLSTGELDKACSEGLAAPIRHETCDSLEAGGALAPVGLPGESPMPAPRRRTAAARPTSGASACENPMGSPYSFRAGRDPAPRS